MPISYKNFPNPLKKGRFFPKVIKGKRIKLAAIVDDIIRQTALTPSEIYGVVSALVNQIIFYLRLGFRPEIDGLGLFSIKLSEDLDREDQSVSNAVKVEVIIKAPRQLTKAVALNLPKQRIASIQRKPRISSLFDAKSKSYNQFYTAGNVARLTGEDLKFNEVALDEGVFFINIADKTEVRVDTYLDISQTFTTFSIPDALIGDQYLEVRSRFGSKTLHKSGLSKLLMAATMA